MYRSNSTSHSYDAQSSPQPLNIHAYIRQHLTMLQFKESNKSQDMTRFQRFQMQYFQVRMETRAYGIKNKTDSIHVSSLSPSSHQPSHATPKTKSMQCNV
jgi:hypothetical protein